MKKNTIIKPPFNERAKNYFRNIRPTKNFVLLIPFVIIAILFILIPIILIVIKSFTPVDNSTISEN
jgi:spermidine/putrescine transport system permease protein